MRSLSLALALVFVVGAPLRAIADTSAEPLSKPIHVTVPSTLTTDSGTELHLPPIYLMSEPQWEHLDAEVKRLQDAETRLTAENKVLQSSDSGPSIGWKMLISATVVGIAVGYYLK